VRILLESEDSRPIGQVVLLLDLWEAKMMRDLMKGLVEDFEKKEDQWSGEHVHIIDKDCSHEVEICIFNPNNLEGLDEDTPKIIKGDY